MFRVNRGLELIHKAMGAMQVTTQDGALTDYRAHTIHTCGQCGNLVHHSMFFNWAGKPYNCTDRTINLYTHGAMAETQTLVTKV